MSANPNPILNLSLDSLAREIELLGEAPYRAGQIFKWLYKRGVHTFDEMTDLSLSFRNKLKTKFTLSQIPFEKWESADGTVKYRFTLEGGSKIESVWIPEEDRKTLCISSQAGCPLKCAFCVTGAVGFKRNLSVAEIVSQVRTVKLQEGLPVTNLVFMGMGEPLLNAEAVISAIGIFTDPRGLSIGKRRITVSTAGMVPEIGPFFEKTDVKIAVSLTGSTDEDRNHWMPINRRYGLSELKKALLALPMQKGRRITFEVVLINEKTDREEDAAHLAEFLSGLQAKVNLIPYNENRFFPDLKKSTRVKAEKFRDILAQKGIHATVRKNRGVDIMAACGQLAGKEANDTQLD